MEDVPDAAVGLAGAGPGVGALEDDPALEAGEGRVPVDRRQVAVLRSAYRATSSVGVAQPSRALRPMAGPTSMAPSPGHIDRSQPRSMSGSPIVDISQSTMAARSYSAAKRTLARW